MNTMGSMNTMDYLVAFVFKVVFWVLMAALFIFLLFIPYVGWMLAWILFGILNNLDDPAPKQAEDSEEALYVPTDWTTPNR